MWLTKLKAALAVVLVLCSMATVGTVLTYRTAAAQGDNKPTAEAAVKPEGKQEKEKERITAWGAEVGGLQAGLSLGAGAKRVYHHGETITLIVRVRNVGKETVKFEYLRQFLDENPPTVTDADGKTVPYNKFAVEGFHVPVGVTLAAGKEIELQSRLGLQYELRPARERGKASGRKLPALHGTGTVNVQYQRVLGDSSAGRTDVDPALRKLATGKLELDIKPALPEKK